MPVPAVIAGGMPTVSSGSQIVTFGSMPGWKMIFLVWVFSLVTTAARPTSEPVPAVVGTATTGAITEASARVHQSPTSSKSNTERVWSFMKAISLPASSAEPPPNATTPSCPPALNAAMPAARFELDRIGLHFGEQFGRRSSRRQRLHRLRRHRHLGDHRIGDEQRVGRSSRPSRPRRAR